MFSRVMRLATMGAFSVLAGCGSQLAPSGTAVGAAPTSTQLRAERQTSGSLQWGIGFSAYPYEIAGSSGWSEDFCQDRNDYPCPYIHYGKSSGHYAASHSVSDPYWGTASLNESGEAKLGFASFSQEESADGYQRNSSVGAYNTARFVWSDYLTPTSSTLPYGTRVALKITITVKPTAIQAACDGSSNPSLLASMNASGGLIEVEGSCEGETSSHSGTFVFREGSSSGPQGTQDKGTFSARIGVPQEITGVAEVQTDACYPGCYGSDSDELAGTAKVTIKPKGTNFTFTTASGYVY